MQVLNLHELGAESNEISCAAFGIGTKLSAASKRAGSKSLELEEKHPPKKDYTAAEQRFKSLNVCDYALVEHANKRVRQPPCRHDKRGFCPPVILIALCGACHAPCLGNCGGESYQSGVFTNPVEL